MFNSPILDLALALSFTYFVLSLVVSTVHEFIYSVWGCKRGVYLKAAIENLFFNDIHWRTLVIKILDNPNISALKKNDKSNPSYIPAQNFALALLDQFKSNTGGSYEFALLDMNKIREKLLDDKNALATGVDGAVRKVLLSLFERAQGDLQHFQREIENYYNVAMERAAGIYVRSTKIKLLVIAVVLAAALNADSVHIAKTLWENPGVLKETADNTQGTINGLATTKDSSGKYQLAGIEIRDNNLMITKAKDTTLGAAADTLRHQVQQTLVYLKSTGIPIGWTKENIPHEDACWQELIDWLFKIIGILLTAAALTLGAPFWFDLINKIINIRATGKKPPDSTTEKNISTSSAASSTQNAVG